VRLYNQVIPIRTGYRQLGASQPLVKPKGIDDVPIMTPSPCNEPQHGQQRRRLTCALRTCKSGLEAGARLNPRCYTVGGGIPTVGYPF